jgi:uridine kinase
VPQREASKNSILLFDGVFLLTPTLRPEWDFVVFVHAPFDITVSRAVERQRRERALSAEDEEALRKEYRERYVPGQQLYLQEVRPATIADAVIDNANLAYPTLHIRPR